MQQTFLVLSVYCHKLFRTVCTKITWWGAAVGHYSSYGTYHHKNSVWNSPYMIIALHSKPLWDGLLWETAGIQNQFKGRIFRGGDSKACGKVAFSWEAGMHTKHCSVEAVLRSHLKNLYHEKQSTETLHHVA